jgi:hypothetical protein
MSSVNKDSFRAKLIREMHKTGCRLDDAAACADVAIRETRKERYESIASCVALGVPVRKVAARFGISYPRVIQIAQMVSGVSGALPVAKSNLPTAA